MVKKLLFVRSPTPFDAEKFEIRTRLERRTKESRFELQAKRSRRVEKGDIFMKKLMLITRP